MVRGLEKFQEYFNDFGDYYTIIGGTACFWNLKEEGLGFRATQDIDLLIILEKYDVNFNQQLWKFFVDGMYKSLYKELTEQKFYRFTDPINSEFPKQIEILCRKPETIKLPEGHTIISIDPEEYFSHLSAIILDEDYYKFTLTNSSIVDRLHISSIKALICLKAFAFLNLSQRKKNGEDIDIKNINKHKRDVFRLGAALRETDIVLPAKLKKDLQTFIELMEIEKPEIGTFMKQMGVNDLSIGDILTAIKTSYGLNS